MTVDEYSQITIDHQAIKGTLVTAWAERVSLFRSDKGGGNYYFRCYRNIENLDFVPTSQGTTFNAIVLYYS